MNQKNKVAFIDLDGTLVKGQSQLLLVYFLFKKGLIPGILLTKIIIFFILYKIGTVKDSKKVFNYSVRFARGMNVNMFKNNVSIFVKEVLSKKIYLKSYDLLKKLKEENYKIVLLSTAIQPLISEVAKLLAIDECISTNLEVNNDTYTGIVSGDIIYGNKKMEVAKSYLVNNNIDVSNSIAYADHESDIPLLNFVGKGYLVNPNFHTQSLATKQGITMIKLS